MLTGVKPFRGKSITEIMSFMESRGPEDIRALNPAVPDSAEARHHQIGRFRAGQRYANAAEFSKAISEAGPFLPRAADPGSAGSCEHALRRLKRVARTASIPSRREGQLHWPPELLREIERDLATFIGPMAAIAVRRAARQTEDVLELYDLLGSQVNDPRDRTEFSAKGRQRAAARLGVCPPSASPKREEDHRTKTASLRRRRPGRRRSSPFSRI